MGSLNSKAVDEAVLRIEGLTTSYGGITVVKDASLVVGPGDAVCIIGANGAGKSTFLKAIAGLLPRAASAVRLGNRDIGALPAYEIVKLGVALVPEGRRLFSSLSVEENLLVGAYGRRTDGPWNLDAIYRLFPILKERRHTPSTALSGGQQQMVAIGRSLMSNPRILMCDELSLGLAPIVIRDIYAALADIKMRGTSVILVEQDLAHAMSVADRAYCFMEGRVSLTGRPEDLTRDAIHAAYFGL